MVNGPEFVVVAVKGWISGVGAKTAYTEPDSPWENGYVESFSGKLRNDHDVAGMEAREQTMQLGLLVAMLHAGPHFNDLLTSRLGQRAALRGGGTLVSGTVPKIATVGNANEHAVSSWRGESSCSRPRAAVGQDHPMRSSCASQPRCRF